METEKPHYADTKALVSYQTRLPSCRNSRQSGCDIRLSGVAVHQPGAHGGGKPGRVLPRPRRCSRGWHEGKNEVLPWWNYFLGLLRAAYKEFEMQVESASSHPAKSDLVRRTA